MTIEQSTGQAEAVVKVRTPRYALVQPLLSAGLYLLLGASAWARENTREFIPFWMAMASVTVALSLWELTWGVDLTPESVNLRGFCRRSIAWPEVQAVLRYERAGSRTVHLIPKNGRPVRLRGPRSFWWMGAAAYERDFHHIEQWWQSHRGESWRPLLPEAVRNQYGLPNPH